MSGKQYLKNQLPVILINLLGMLALALFLIASDNPIQTVLFILAVWSMDKIFAQYVPLQEMRSKRVSSASRSRSRSKKGAVSEKTLMESLPEPPG